MTSILATYAHLRVVFSGRGDTAANSTNLLLRLNNDSTANYDYQLLQANAAVATSAETFGATFILAGTMAAATAAASLTGHSVFDIMNYAGTTFNKSVTVVAGFKTGVATGNLFNYKIDGHWRSTTAINRVTLIPNAGNFIAGSRLTVYAFGA